jgi:hypothetical protein
METFRVESIKKNGPGIAGTAAATTCCRPFIVQNILLVLMYLFNQLLPTAMAY